MSETETADDEETLDEDEEELKFTDLSSFKTYLKNQVISVSRQLLCSCSVMIFPALGILYGTIGVPLPQNVKIMDEITHEVDKIATDKASFLELTGDATVATITGTIIAGLLLYFIGRKYTVIIANSMHLAALIYSYKIGVESVLPYNLVLILLVIQNFCFVTYFIYVAEISTTIFRPFFMGVYFFNEAVFDDIMTTALKEERINRTLRNCAIITSLSLLLATYIPETPFWLILKGYPEKAEENFTWLRAGNLNTIEFNQMMGRAENILETKGIIQHLFSRTFVVGLMFSIFIVICNFNPCIVLETFLNDFYFPYNMELEAVHWWEIYYLMTASNGLDLRHRTYGSFFFFSFSFVVPRKIMYFLSYSLGVFIIIMVMFHLGPMHIMIKMASFCNLSPYMGVLQLSMILPVEIYPAALREVGVTFTTITIQASKYYNSFSAVRSRKYFPKPWVIRRMSYVCYFGSFIGITFILMFMPETYKKSVYELDELNIRLPFRRRKKSSAGEDEDGNSEDPSGEGEELEENQT